MRVAPLVTAAALAIAALAAIPFLSALLGPAEAAHILHDRDLPKGEALYAQHCASCHGADLKGQSDWQTPGVDGILPAPPHDETGHSWHHDTDLLFSYTKLGGAGALAARGITDFKSGMPAFGDTLEDDDIYDILGYIRSTWPKEVQDAHDGMHAAHD